MVKSDAICYGFDDARVHKCLKIYLKYNMHFGVLALSRRRRLAPSVRSTGSSPLAHPVQLLFSIPHAYKQTLSELQLLIAITD